MKPTYEDAIIKLYDFVDCFNALSIEDRLLFAVIGPDGAAECGSVASAIGYNKKVHEYDDAGISDMIDAKPYGSIVQSFADTLEAKKIACLNNPDTWVHFKDGTKGIFSSMGMYFNFSDKDKPIPYKANDGSSSAPGRFQITAHFFNEAECIKFRDFSRQHIVSDPSTAVTWLDEEGLLCLQLISLRDSDLAKVFDATKDFSFAELEVWKYGEAVKNWVKVGDFYPEV